MLPGDSQPIQQTTIRPGSITREMLAEDAQCKSAAEVIGNVAIAALLCALVAFIVYAFAIA